MFWSLAGILRVSFKKNISSFISSSPETFLSSANLTFLFFIQYLECAIWKMRGKRAACPLFHHTPALRSDGSHLPAMHRRGSPLVGSSRSKNTSCLFFTWGLSPLLAQQRPLMVEPLLLQIMTFQHSSR